MRERGGLQTSLWKKVKKQIAFSLFSHTHVPTKAISRLPRERESERECVLVHEKERGREAGVRERHDGGAKASFARANLSARRKKNALTLLLLLLLRLAVGVVADAAVVQT